MPVVVETPLRGRNVIYLTGPHVPDGGTTGQVLVKQSDEDHDVDWGSAGGSWATIEGDIADNTDLQAALDAKADDSDLSGYATTGHNHNGTYQPLATVLTNTTASFTTAQETKLAGVATGATANDTDANLKNRANHTGTQAHTTITGLGTVATLDETTTAQYRANTADKALSTDQVWAAADYVALTDAATVAVDMSAGFNFSLTIGGNRTLGAPSNTKNGQTGAIVITQDGTGSRTLAYHANWKFAGGTDPTLSTAAGAVDVLFYQVISSTSIIGNLVKAIA